MLNGGALREKLIGGLLDAGLGVLVVKVETGDGGVGTSGGGAGEGEHEALGNAVKLTVGLEADGLPLAGALNPVAHVVDGGVASGGGGGELTELDNLSTTLLDARSELVDHPAVVDHASSVSTSDLGVSDVWVHGW